MNSDEAISAGQTEVGDVSSDGRPRIWTVWVAVLVALIASLGVSIVLVLIMLWIDLSGGGTPKDFAADLARKLMSPPLFLLTIILSQIALGSVALLGAYKSPEPFRERLGLRPARCSARAYPLFMIGSLLPLAIGIGAAHLVALFIKPDETALMLYEQMTTLWAIPFIVVIGVAPGIMEELLFRGYVQGRFMKRWGPFTAILVTSIIFGLFHVTPHAVAMATIMGFWLGTLAWRTNSVLPGILCHAFVNSTWNVWQVGQRLWGMPEHPSTTVIVIVAVIVFVCFVASVRIIVRARD